MKKTYLIKKGEARQNAINYQLSSSDKNLSLNEIAEKQNYFEKVGKRYGLLKEFRENGIL